MDYDGQFISAIVNVYLTGNLLCMAILKLDRVTRIPNFQNHVKPLAVFLELYSTILNPLSLVYNYSPNVHIQWSQNHPI